MTLEIWLDVENISELNYSADVDKLICKKESVEKYSNFELIILDEKSIYNDFGENIGKYVHIENQEGQNEAKALVGSVSWIMITANDWKMIPLENIIATAQNTPTKIAAKMDSIEQLMGAAYALGSGVDALIISDLNESLNIANSIKNDKKLSDEILINSNNISIKEVELIEIVPVGNADRVCIDLVNMMNVGDGIFVGSSSKSMLLMHSETIESEFVPTRPFRINAGAVHAYTLLEDGSTKYLCELKAGERILVSNAKGESYPSTIGRLKIEPRPMLMLKWRDENNNENQSFVQQAETVRVMNNLGEAKSVTKLLKGEHLLARIESGGRHIGKEIRTNVEER